MARKITDDYFTPSLVPTPSPIPTPTPSPAPTPSPTPNSYSNLSDLMLLAAIYIQLGQLGFVYRHPLSKWILYSLAYWPDPGQ